MRLSYYDATFITPTSLTRGVKALRTYRDRVTKVITTADQTVPEYALAHVCSPTLLTELQAIKAEFKKVKHVFLIGIGGSSLGVEAVHQVLDTGKVSLTVLDTISAAEMTAFEHKIQKIKNPEQIAVCVISKSGKTTETLVNANVALTLLEKTFGKKIYKQVICIGDPKTDLMKTGKRIGAKLFPMPEVVGGRYSVATEAGLIPLTLLGHDVESFIEGVRDAATEEYDSLVAEAAVRIQQYMQKNYSGYTFFAFEKRLETLGAWYRQLFAESLGKATTIKKEVRTKGMVPTIATPVELHSVGQLYLSKTVPVYTDFVTFDDDQNDYPINKKGLGAAFGHFSMQEVATALYAGVIGAYQTAELPYRTTIFDEDLAYSLGVFMAARMREVMYAAHLLEVNAFNQPNVELYKQKTKQVLGL